MKTSCKGPLHHIKYKLTALKLTSISSRFKVQQHKMETYTSQKANRLPKDGRQLSHKANRNIPSEDGNSARREQGDQSVIQAPVHADVLEDEDR
ncbi:hypothetical protein SLA2020_410940 [Shorea laevis]